MKRTKLASNSRYVGTPLVQLADRSGSLVNSYAFTTWNRIEVRPTTADVMHKVTENEIGRLDILANKYYGDPFLWWVIADRNNMMYPIDEMYVGKDLYIPPIQAIRNALNRAAQS